MSQLTSHQISNYDPFGDERALKNFIAARNKALEELDITWARIVLESQGQSTKDKDDEFLLVTLHKARYEVASMPMSLRLESMKWLQERGLTRIGGLPWPATGAEDIKE